jgi:hypothetical protein
LLTSTRQNTVELDLFAVVICMVLNTRLNYELGLPRFHGSS